MSTLLQKLFPMPKPIIGMIHVFEGELNSMINQALEDLDRLQPFVSGVLVENYGWGYEDNNRTSSDAVGIIFTILMYVMARSKIPVGVNLLPNDYLNAFTLCGETGASFVQLDHVTGNFRGCDSVNQLKLEEIRRCYPSVALLGGIHPKYYDLVPPIPMIQDTAQVAKRLVDAIVVTGEHTGGSANVSDLTAVRQAVGDFPIIIGSGLNSINAFEQLSIADGAIVGTAFKDNGVKFGEHINPALVGKLMTEINKLKK